MTTRLFLLLLLVFWAGAVRCEPTGRMDAGNGWVPEVRILEDASGKLTIEKVTHPDMRPLFRHVAGSRASLNFGFTSSVYWLHLRLSQSQETPTRWLLELANASLAEVDFYAPGQAPVYTGSRRPLDSRPIYDRYPVLPVTLTDAPQDFYLRVQSNYALDVPLRLWNPDARQRSESNALMLQYVYQGGLLMLVLLTLLLSFSLRDRRIAYYAIYAIALGMGMLAGNGLGRLVLWPQAPAFDEISQSFLLGLSGTAALLFTRAVIRADIGMRTEKLMRAAAAVFLLLSCLLLSGLWWPTPVRVELKFLSLCAPLSGVLVIFSCVSAYQRGNKSLRILIMGWASLWLGVAVASMRNLGWIPTNPVTAYAIQIASSLEMFLLALALAEIVYLERKAREARTLEALRISGEKLEAAVQARTAELQIASAQLQEALFSEKEVLTQFVRFGSMISHEFRNPLAVIDSQVRLLQREHEQGIESMKRRLPIVLAAVARLVRMFDQWLHSDRLGQSLDEFTPHSIPLRPWLEHLVEGLYCLSEHRLELQLAPEPAYIFGDDHLLEMALVNLVENASKYAPPGTVINLTTRVSPGQVGLAVCDQGPGIAQDQQKSVFEDFYRIQPEGGVEGLGLGLSIVRRITSAHGGKLTLESIPGQGCCFCIWLPCEVQLGTQ